MPHGRPEAQGRISARSIVVVSCRKSLFRQIKCLGVRCHPSTCSSSPQPCALAYARLDHPWCNIRGDASSTVRNRTLRRTSMLPSIHRHSRPYSALQRVRTAAAIFPPFTFLFEARRGHSFILTYDHVYTHRTPVDSLRLNPRASPADSPAANLRVSPLRSPRHSPFKLEHNVEARVTLGRR